MGLLLMLFITIIIFFVLKLLFGFIVSMVLSLIFLVGWGLFNIMSGTKGLFKSNMRMYFSLRARGFNREDAIEGVINSRYPDSVYLRINTLNSFRELCGSALDVSEEEYLKLLVYLIFCNEAFTPSSEQEKRKITDQIDKIYNSLRWRYNYKS